MQKTSSIPICLNTCDVAIAMRALADATDDFSADAYHVATSSANTSRMGIATAK
eukprot:CAMPEP_0169280688 /NCGR_PEP_ID=MMETSP1016-20121227/55767_1 /TAXON_ID=342587 /ORGANISM="Karlodinium micrum, Strain CCMP2283" /LENGTH=53 /DNA_ID=CAMNT_0009369083 /DNA_START=268 /DNA_END=426 /DNA_ORIENTATION=-